MSHETPADQADHSIDYEAFQASPEFQAMKRRFRSFVFPLAAAFMIWFLLYVLLAAYAHDFMSQPFWGLNVGLWLGLAQFATTFAITMWYVSYANRKIDPLTTDLRAELERAAAGETGAGVAGPEAGGAR